MICFARTHDEFCHVPLYSGERQRHLIAHAMHERDAPRRCEEQMFCLEHWSRA